MTDEAIPSHRHSVIVNGEKTNAWCSLKWNTCMRASSSVRVMYLDKKIDEGTEVGDLVIASYVKEKNNEKVLASRIRELIELGFTKNDILKAFDNTPTT